MSDKSGITSVADYELVTSEVHVSTLFWFLKLFARHLFLAEGGGYSFIPLPPSLLHQVSSRCCLLDEARVDKLADDVYVAASRCNNMSHNDRLKLEAARHT